MRDYKYWVNGYNEVLGEFSVGFKDNTNAFNYYCERLREIERDNGEIELLEVEVLCSHKEKK